MSTQFNPISMNYWGVSQPRYVTKYCDDDARQCLLNGSLKFGSLIGYRKGEETRFTDQSEGMVERVINFQTEGPVSHFKTPIIETFGNLGVTIKNCGYSKEFDERVFCSSIGPYDTEHHKVMLEKNSDVRHYLVFDLRRLIAGLVHETRNNAEYTLVPGKLNVVYGAISYKEKAREENPVLNASFGYQSPKFSPNEFLKSVFTKPPFYCYENEHRIMLRLHATEAPATDGHPIFVENDYLRKAIVESGTI